MNLHYFDFTPPPGWIGFRKVKQVRLIPPNTHPKDATCAIIVSPLAPRGPLLPPADILLEQTLAFEHEVTGADVVAKHGPIPTKSDHGLAGVYFDVTLKAPTGTERRLYVLLVDELCYYGLSFLSVPSKFDEHVDEFWTATRSIKPWAGRVIPPGGVPFAHYED